MLMLPDSWVKDGETCPCFPHEWETCPSEWWKALPSSDHVAFLRDTIHTGTKLAKTWVEAIIMPMVKFFAVDPFKQRTQQNGSPLYFAFKEFYFLGLRLAGFSLSTVQRTGESIHNGHHSNYLNQCLNIHTSGFIYLDTEWKMFPTRVVTNKI